MIGPRNPVFVVFEGLDGSGKSVSAKRTAEMLGARYMATPNETLCNHRAEILESFSGCQEAAQLMYLASVASASQEIRHVQLAGQSVVLDRYLLSTQVYAAFRGSAFSGDEAITKILRPADLTVYLDAPLSVRRERVQRRSAAVSAADMETLSERSDLALRKAYLRRFKLPINGKVILLDSSQLTIDEIAQAVIAELHKLLGECK